MARAESRFFLPTCSTSFARSSRSRMSLSSSASMRRRVSSTLTEHASSFFEKNRHADRVRGVSARRLRPTENLCRRVHDRRPRIGLGSEVANDHYDLRSEEHTSELQSRL